MVVQVVVMLMVHGGYGERWLWWIVMVHGGYGSRWLWCMVVMVHGGYGAWWLWCKVVMVHDNGIDNHMEMIITVILV